MDAKFWEPFQRFAATAKVCSGGGETVQTVQEVTQPFSDTQLKQGVNEKKRLGR